MCLWLHMNSRRSAGPFYKDVIKDGLAATEPNVYGLRNPSSKARGHAIACGFIIVRQCRSQRHLASNAADDEAVGYCENRKSLEGLAKALLA
jgi:hypothetical protein